jgi:hypothetical protein
MDKVEDNFTSDIDTDETEFNFVSDIESEYKLEYKPIKLELDIEQSSCNCKECDKWVYKYDINTNKMNKYLSRNDLIRKLERGIYDIKKNSKGLVVIDGDGIILSSLVKIRCDKGDLYLMPIDSGMQIKQLHVYKLYTRQEIMDKSDKSDNNKKHDFESKCERKIYKRMNKLMKMTNDNNDSNEMIKLYIDYIIE